VPSRSRNTGGTVHGVRLLSPRDLHRGPARGVLSAATLKALTQSIRTNSISPTLWYVPVSQGEGGAMVEQRACVPACAGRLLSAPAGLRGKPSSRADRTSGAPAPSSRSAERTQFVTNCSLTGEYAARRRARSDQPCPAMLGRSGAGCKAPAHPTARRATTAARSRSGRTAQAEPTRAPRVQRPRPRNELAPGAAPSRARPSGRPRDLDCPLKGSSPAAEAAPQNEPNVPESPFRDQPVPICGHLRHRWVSPWSLPPLLRNEPNSSQHLARERDTQPPQQKVGVGSGPPRGATPLCGRLAERTQRASGCSRRPAAKRTQSTHSAL
jgi:hypothetical protein